MLTGLGARVVSLPRDTHDEVVAIVSHVPHFVASSLVELAVRHAGDQEALFRLAAGGFKDSTVLQRVLLLYGPVLHLIIEMPSWRALMRFRPF